MADPTTQELLSAVNVAIKTLLDGGAVQRFVIRGKDISMYGLDTLYQLRDSLMRELAEVNNAGGVSVIRARLRPET